MNYTFNDITNTIKDLCKSHKMVHSFNLGETLKDIDFDDENTSPEYPFIYLQPISTTLNEGSMTTTYTMLVMNLVDAEQGNYNQVQSDMLNIGMDIIYTLMIQYNDFEIGLPINVNYFTERFNNEISGVNITFNIESPIDINTCLLPFN